MNIAAQPVEFRHNDGRLDLFGLPQRCGKLWAFVQGVGSFSSLDLNKLTIDLKSLGSGKSRNSLALRFKAGD